jgi:hypothetical protein
MVKEFSLKFLHGDSDADTHQNILESWRRNCNRSEIAEGNAPFAPCFATSS